MPVVQLAHGAGAVEMWRLINELIVSKVPRDLRAVKGGFGIDVLDDGAVIKVGDQYVVLTIDSYTVNPIFFPGGDIGHLAACGTINDLVVMGARPVAFMDTVIAEEGLPTEVLERVVNSMIKVLVSEGVALIGGDFKVMPKGSLDRVVITGTGVGLSKRPVVDTGIRPGDKLIVISPIAEHGAAILAAQLGMDSDVKGVVSDSRPLTRSLLPVIEVFREGIHAARDPTRGGVAAVLNEWSRASGLTAFIERSRVPIREGVKAFLDAIGVDPLSLASEGSAVLAVDPGVAEVVVDELRRLGEGYAEVIGEFRESPTPFLKGRVVAITEVGGKVLVEPKSVNLPRIC